MLILWCRKLKDAKKNIDMEHTVTEAVIKISLNVIFDCESHLIFSFIWLNPRCTVLDATIVLGIQITFYVSAILISHLVWLSH